MLNRSSLGEGAVPLDLFNNTGGLLQSKKHPRGRKPLISSLEKRWYKYWHPQKLMWQM